MSNPRGHIEQRLSLRPPQRESLEALERVVGCIEAGTNQFARAVDTDAVKARVKAAFPETTFDDFERDFPSVCFALATGVGKTRLMGAMVAWLYLTGRSRHFFVLAPNLTIYEKLIADFTHGTPKYVFHGLAEMAVNAPVVITGDTYESGRGVEDEIRRQEHLFGGADALYINIFNVSKINSEVRGGKPARMKRLHEVLGQSYFDYLAGLPDLVLLMDESHRYRAEAGMRAISELKPVLGLEFTATPFVETAKDPIPFRNVVVNYPLPKAIDDGFVKIPAVATRKDFDPASVDPSALESIKLDDGIRLHEETKVHLRLFSEKTGAPFVKPFVLVIAKDTDHANALTARIKSADFFGGQYADKVIAVHSNLSGAESDENVRLLLGVEKPDNPTEIVVHVNKLKEGWDVTNLFTIIPLRAANARTLVEQSIGRGLRLPYGQRTGDPGADRLTIVAHDRFKEIIDEARKGDSILQKIETIVIDAGAAARPPTLVELRPVMDRLLFDALPQPGREPVRVATTVEERQVVTTCLQVIRDTRLAAPSTALLDSASQERMVEAVRRRLPASVIPLFDVEKQQDLAGWVRETATQWIRNTIDIPRVIVEAKQEVRWRFLPFTLDLVGFTPQPVSNELLLQHLRTAERETVQIGGVGKTEARLEDYVVRAVLEHADVEYDSNSDVLYGLADQVVRHLAGYLPDEDAVLNVLRTQERNIGDLVHSQMQKHVEEPAVEWIGKVTAGFIPLEPTQVSLGADETPRNVRDAVAQPSRIKEMVFGSFRRCCFDLAKFDSDPERRFAAIIDDDNDVLKWVRPPERNFQIHLPRGGKYHPDFVVETKDARYLCEVKARNEIDTVEVRQKTAAALTWCRHASEFTATTDRKPWRYVLIPDADVLPNRSFAWLATTFERRATS